MEYPVVVETDTGLPVVGSRCKADAAFGFHPDGYIDRYSVEDILHEMDHMEMRQCTRTELVEYWLLRQQCPICQAALTDQTAKEFADAVVKLYLCLAQGHDGGYDEQISLRLQAWAAEALAHRARPGGLSSPLAKLEELNPTADEVSELALLMLKPFDYGHAVQAIVHERAIGWTKEGCWREKWAETLRDRTIHPSLDQLVADEEQFIWYFLGLSKAEGMPDPDCCLHDTHWFGRLLRMESGELEGIAAGTNPVLSMAASLLLTMSAGASSA